MLFLLTTLINGETLKNVLLVFSWKMISKEVEIGIGFFFSILPKFNSLEHKVGVK